MDELRIKWGLYSTLLRMGLIPKTHKIKLSEFQVGFVYVDPEFAGGDPPEWWKLLAEASYGK